MQKQNKFKQKFTKYDISISLTIKLATDADNVTASIGLLDATFRCNCSTLFVQSLNCFCNTSKLADADANASDIQPNGLALITETNKKYTENLAMHLVKVKSYQLPLSSSLSARRCSPPQR